MSENIGQLKLQAEGNEVVTVCHGLELEKGGGKLSPPLVETDGGPEREGKRRNRPAMSCPRFVYNLR